jgi:predicted CXXCH cytochrome family protein
MKMGCEICHQPVEDMKHPDKKGSMKLVKGVPLLCDKCHENKAMKKNVHKPVEQGRCTYCHNVHMSDNTSLITMRTPKFEIKHVNDICVSCHLDLAVGVHLLAGLEGPHPMWKKPDPSRPNKEMSCASCHDPHSSDFPVLAPKKNLCVICHEKFH